MTDHLAARLRRLASPHRPSPLGALGRRAAALLLRLGCVALLSWIGCIHLHLWLEGYRHIPTNGPLFLADAVAGFALAAGLLMWPAPLAGLLGAGYTAATLGALLISLTVGLFGFRESISASYVAQSLTIEPVAVLALLAWTVLVTATPQPPHRPRQVNPTRKAEHRCNTTAPRPAACASFLGHRDSERRREQPPDQRRPLLPPARLPRSGPAG
jgi:hypothetical protein